MLKIQILKIYKMFNFNKIFKINNNYKFIFMSEKATIHGIRAIV